MAAVWTLAKCGTALGAFQLVWSHFVDPFILSKTSKLAESGRGSSVFDRSRRREDPLAHKRAARRASTKAGGLAAKLAEA